LEVTYTDDIIIDNGRETEILTFMMAVLANIEASWNHETELYDSGTSNHMSPYHNKFLNLSALNPKQSEQQTAKNLKRLDWVTCILSYLMDSQSCGSYQKMCYTHLLWDLPWSLLAKSPKPGLRLFFTQIF
jgi:hypothetical protein